MRGKFIIIVLIQIALLAGMIGYREYWIALGEKVLLRTAPVDPRDLFRGDYVQLSYEITALELDRLGVTDQFKPNQTIYVKLEKDEEGVCRATGAGSALPGEGTRFIRGTVRSVQAMKRWEITVKESTGNLHALRSTWFSGMNKGERVVFCVGQAGRILNHYKADSAYKPGCSFGASLEGTIEDMNTTAYQQVTAEYGIESYFVEEGKGRALEQARNAREVKVEVSLREDGKGIITRLVMDDQPGAR